MEKMPFAIEVPQPNRILCGVSVISRARHSLIAMAQIFLTLLLSISCSRNSIEWDANEQENEWAKFAFRQTNYCLFLTFQLICLQ